MNESKRNRFLVLALSGFLVMAIGFPAQVTAITIGQETDTGGFIGPLVGPSPDILVASDGESPFRPFGSTVNVTDAIQFTDGANWAFDPRFNQGAWQQLNPNTWILPAIGENEPGFTESIGHWFFVPGSSWTPGTPVEQVILDSQGNISDVITLNNTGPNGSAAITFSSDPFVPEPSTLLLLAIGAISLLAYRKAK